MNVTVKTEDNTHWVWRYFVISGVNYHSTNKIIGGVDFLAVMNALFMALSEHNRWAKVYFIVFINTCMALLLNRRSFPVAERTQIRWRTTWICETKSILEPFKFKVLILTKSTCFFFWENKYFWFKTLSIQQQGSSRVKIENFMKMKAKNNTKKIIEVYHSGYFTGNTPPKDTKENDVILHWKKIFQIWKKC